MRILVLTPNLVNTSPGMRFRIEQWARYLEPKGLEFTFVAFEDESLNRVLYKPGQYASKSGLIARAFVRRFRLLPRLRDFDVILLHREAAIMGPALLERLIARKGVPIVYDFDDPIWLSYKSPANGFLSYLKFPGKVAGICRLATAVTTGNRLLADWAKQHARSVHIVPSTVDLKQCPVQQVGGNHRPLTLGWTGSYSTLQFLESLKPVFQRFANLRKYRLLVIAHTDSYRMENVPVEIWSKRWRADSEGQDLLDMDIGLAPFPNTGWTPWRCHGKVLQYMAGGIPTVTSPIGILPEYIQDGVNGFLAGDDEQWIDRLARLSDDAALRRQIGLAGRATVEERFSADVWAPRVQEILETAASSK